MSDSREFVKFSIVSEIRMRIHVCHIEDIPTSFFEVQPGTEKEREGRNINNQVRKKITCVFGASRRVKIVDARF